MHIAWSKWVGISPTTSRGRSLASLLCKAACDYQTFFERFPSLATECFNVNAVSIWAHDAVNARLIHVTSSGIPHRFMDTIVMDVASCLCGKCVEDKWPLLNSELTKNTSGRHDLHPNQTRELDLKYMCSVPVLNASNPNQVLFVVNLLSRGVQDYTQSELKELGSLFDCYYESLLHSFCTRHENLLRMDLSSLRTGRLKNLCSEFAARVKEATEASLVAVFLQRDGELKLMGYELPDLRKMSETDLYDLATQAAHINREVFKLPSNLRNDPGVSVSRLAVPIRDVGGSPVGAIVCLKNAVAKSTCASVFTPDSVTISDWLGRAFAPFYELLSSEEERLAALDELGHELKHPVTAMNGGLALASHFAPSQGPLARYLKDLRSYAEIMTRNLQGFLAMTDENLENSLKREQVHWVADLVAPATKAVEHALRQRGAHRFRIERPGLDAAPKMLLDKRRMLQVVFNLLENGIKYSKGEGREVRIEITYRAIAGRYEICFRDWGLGVPEGLEEKIFKMGFRAPDRSPDNVGGKGFGLAISRTIVRAHGGDLIYRRHSAGSDFIISLPIRLEQSRGR